MIMFKLLKIWFIKSWWVFSLKIFIIYKIDLYLIGSIFDKFISSVSFLSKLYFWIFKLFSSRCFLLYKFSSSWYIDISLLKNNFSNIIGSIVPDKPKIFIIIFKFSSSFWPLIMHWIKISTKLSFSFFFNSVNKSLSLLFSQELIWVELNSFSLLLLINKNFSKFSAVSLFLIELIFCPIFNEFIYSNIKFG